MLNCLGTFCSAAGTESEKKGSLIQPTSLLQISCEAVAKDLVQPGLSWRRIVAEIEKMPIPSDLKPTLEQCAFKAFMLQRSRSSQFAMRASRGYVISSSERLYSWGNGTSKSFGDVGTPTQLRPVLVQGRWGHTPLISIQSSDDDVAALAEDGTIYVEGHKQSFSVPEKFVDVKQYSKKS
jgi:hypothetical protein